MAMRRAAEATPAHRDRYVDLLRAIAIAAVVLGHWLAVHVAPGLRGGSVLETVGWTRPLTWLFQVMPIFFLVGGYANAASYVSYRGRGGNAVEWVLRRTGRLVRPTAALLAVLTAAALAARAAGVDAALVGTGVWLAGIPLWFLVAYIAVVALTPVMYGAHLRYGLAVPVALAALVALGDLARLGVGVPYVGDANYLFAWLAVHQLGVAWRDGRLPARRAVALPMAGFGLAALAGLTLAGPYPVSMVAVPGEEIQNTSPPTVALLALAVTQTGVALLPHDAGNRWLRRTRPWTAVVAVNSVIMTLFLWHMTAVVLAVLALHAAGLLPEAVPGSPEWLLLRPPWLALLALILAALVAVFGRVERRIGPLPGPGSAAGAGPAVLTAAGVAGVLGGILAVAVAGPGDHGPAGLSTAGLIAFFAGAAVLRFARRRFADADQPAGNI